MKKQAGLWIDRRKAVIVTMTSAGEESKTIESDFEGHVRYSGGPKSQPEDARDRRLAKELDRFYDQVIASIRDAEEVVIFGPGEAKGELKTRLERDHLGDLIAAIEPADKMTDPQIAARVRQHFSGAS